MKKQIEQQRQSRLSRTLNTFIAFSVFALILALTVTAFQTWGKPHFFTEAMLSLEPALWIDIGLWALAVTSIILLIILLWLTLAFSVIALVVALSIGAALIMIFSGASLLWPILLLILAAWGIGQASQFD
ncbi:hypothetical protein [Shewanella sp. UCD-KL12]|uniref:hypothetical protein n=1 Tax=Shewanella sp. UCD-KL12 TaxID=1917163 RepID=UPI0009FAE013|nr:hypothetical protein [Shewanella sp. UCD-KL12]